MLMTGTDVLEAENDSKSASAPRTVWLVDDDDTLRSLLADSLPQFANLEVARTFNSVPALLNALETLPHPEVLVLDVNIGCDNGVECLPQIVPMLNSTAVAMLTTCFDPFLETKALARGASEFLLKSQPLHEIAKSIFDIKQAERGDCFEAEHAAESEVEVDPEPATTWAARFFNAFPGRLRLKRA
jgi:DNA-binding NarL/FixJ family response regulator